MIQFSRIHSSGKHYFFGSDLPTNDFIELTIEQGVKESDLSTERYHNDYSGKTYCKVQMTPNAFAELITRMNIGDGIPCSVTVVDGKIIPQEENQRENRKMFTHRKFKERMGTFAEELQVKSKEMERIMKKQSLSAQDKKDVVWAYQKLVQELSSNIPFFMECFQETMDDVVLEAKQQIDAALMNKVTTLGLQALQDENNNLIGPTQE